LGEPNITPDEWFILRIVREGHCGSSTRRHFEPHPPLYPYAVMAIVGLAGDSEYALRFLSVAFG